MCAYKSGPPAVSGRTACIMKIAADCERDAAIAWGLREGPGGAGVKHNSMSRSSSISRDMLNLNGFTFKSKIDHRTQLCKSSVTLLVQWNYSTPGSRKSSYVLAAPDNIEFLKYYDLRSPIIPMEQDQNIHSYPSTEPDLT